MSNGNKAELIKAEGLKIINELSQNLSDIDTCSLSFLKLVFMSTTIKYENHYSGLLQKVIQYNKSIDELFPACSLTNNNTVYGVPIMNLQRELIQNMLHEFAGKITSIKMQKNYSRTLFLSCLSVVLSLSLFVISYRYTNKKIEEDRKIDMIRNRKYVKFAIMDLENNLDIIHKTRDKKAKIMEPKSAIPRSYSLLGLESILQNMVIIDEKLLDELVHIRDYFLSTNTIISMINNGNANTTNKNSLFNNLDDKKDVGKLEHLINSLKIYLANMR